jgi:hypothetical protein
MRRLLILLLLPFSAAFAAKDDTTDRIAVVARLYRDFGAEDAPSLVDQPSSVLQRYFTPGVVLLLAEESKRRTGPPAEVGHLDFEPLSGSQDPDVHDLNFRPVGKDGVLAIYRTSTGKKITIRYHLRPVGDAWRIDDISYIRTRCSLRALLNQKDDSAPTSFREPVLEAAPIKPLPLRPCAPPHEEVAEADAALNSEYRKLSTALGIDARERLIRAQRTWIRERDAFVAAHSSRREEALLHATRQRTRELAAILAGPVLPAH